MIFIEVVTQGRSGRGLKLDKRVKIGTVCGGASMHIAVLYLEVHVSILVIGLVGCGPLRPKCSISASFVWICLMKVHSH